MVGGVIESLTDEQLASQVSRPEPGWPQLEDFPFKECLLIVLNEEWEHRGYAERDLAEVDRRIASLSDGGWNASNPARWWIAVTIAGSIVVVALGVVIGVRGMADRGAARGRGGGDSRELPRRCGASTPSTACTSTTHRARESIDVLGGDSHTYPAETALTVMTEGCGVRMTWKPLAGRSESWLVCPLDGGWVSLARTACIHSSDRPTTPRSCATANVVDAATGHVELDQLVRQHRSHVDSNGTNRRGRAIRDRR